ncbi:MAG TPA: hypothetical protein VJ253_09635 [Dehalococcoidia bacterium]|nr:hypothetical protein [Dehalococcoidia bacterium]
MPFGSSKSTRPEDEDALRQDTPDGSVEETEDASDGDGEETSAPAGNGQTEGAPYKRMSFRPDYLDDTAPHDEAPATAVAEMRPPPRGDAFFVSVTRDGVPDLHRFDSAAEAQAFVEEQLGDGVQQEDISAFSGHRLAFNVSHRPIVKLLTPEE